MSEKSIRKLKHKFILSSMLALLLVMFMLAGMIYATNVFVTRRNIRGILNYIIDNEGELDGSKTLTESSQEGKSRARDRGYDVIRFLSEIFQGNEDETDSPEFRYANRYFAVIFDEAGEVDEIKTSSIDSLTAAEAEAYGRAALARRFRFGRDEDYYYQVERRRDGSSIVVYLDSTYQVAVTNRLLYSALILICFSFLVALVFVWIFSDRAIKPEIKNADMQKLFITNASHELKTPLAVIKANTEMQEILEGETEWSQSTLRQVERLTGLIQNLVLISRGQEQEEREDAVEINIAQTVRETIQTFAPVAEQDGKRIETNVMQDLVMRANESQIRQLTSLLLDNAIKYCDTGGSLGVSLQQKGKGAVLAVSNSYAQGKSIDYSRFFERFYREDKSRNTDRGGYGIGLSIAQNLVDQYHGKIQASWKDGRITFTCVLKPY